MNIEIDDIKEVRQLEKDKWKSAIYFDDKFASDFLQLKKKAKETGRKMILTLQTEHAQVVPYDDVLLGEIHHRAEGLTDFIRGEIDKRKPVIDPESDNRTMVEIIEQAVEEGVEDAG